MRQRKEGWGRYSGWAVALEVEYSTSTYMKEYKTIKVDKETWRRLKRKSADLEIPIKDIIKELMESY